MSDTATLGRAILMMIAAICCFDLMAVLVRVLSSTYSTHELAAYRNVIGMIPSLILMVWTGELTLKRANYRTGNWPLAVGRGVAIAIAQLTFFTALAHLELATVAALAQTNGLFVVLFSIVILGERVGPWRWAALGVGFAGAVWIIRPGGDAISVYAILPTIAAACYAFTTVSVRKFPVEVSNALLYLYSSVAAGLGAIVLALATTRFTPIASAMDGLLIFTLGMLGGVGVLFIMIAFRMAPPSKIAPFSYFGILTAFVWGWLFFGEAPVETLFPGVLLIVGAGAMIIWRERVSARAARARASAG